MIFIKNFTPSNFWIFNPISESLFSTPSSQNEVWKDEMIDLDSGSTGTTTDSRIWLKSSKDSGVEIGSEVGPNQEVEILIHIHFPQRNVTF